MQHQWSTIKQSTIKSGLYRIICLVRYHINIYYVLKIEGNWNYNHQIQNNSYLCVWEEWKRWLIWWRKSTLGLQLYQLSLSLKHTWEIKTTYFFVWKFLFKLFHKNYLKYSSQNKVRSHPPPLQKKISWNSNSFSMTIGSY